MSIWSRCSAADVDEVKVGGWRRRGRPLRRAPLAWQDERSATSRGEQQAITGRLRERSQRITAESTSLSKLQIAKDAELRAQVSGFQKAGLSGSIADLQRLVTRQGQLTTEINRIDQNARSLAALREGRQSLLKDLHAVRAEITDRRKSLVRELNTHIAGAIDDYTVALRLDPDGIIDDFVTFVTEEMHGTYLQDEVARRVCWKLSPQQLAEFVRATDHASIASTGAVSTEWAQKLCAQLNTLERLHRLETIWKTPRPEILVLPKVPNPKPDPSQPTLRWPTSHNLPHHRHARGL